MPVSRIVWFAAMPVLALLGGLMLLLSGDAPPSLFGLFLSIGSWFLVLAFVALPYIAYKQWTAKRDDL